MLYAVFIFFKHCIFKRKSVGNAEASHILSRVKFHAPKLYDRNINFDILWAAGIRTSEPIYKITYLPSVKEFLLLKLAQEQAKFTIVFILEQTDKADRLSRKYLRQYVIYNKSLISFELLSNINKLNINYESDANHLHYEQHGLFSINDVVFVEKSMPYFLYSNDRVGDVHFLHKEFVLNGKNHILKFMNQGDSAVKTRVVFRELLPENYYHFETRGFTVLARSLLEGNGFYLNASQKPVRTAFSCVTGLEFSRFAKVEAEFYITLKAKETRFLSLNFGDTKISINKDKIQKMFELSQQHFEKMFNFKIQSGNCLLDERINKILPKKIALSFMNQSPLYKNSKQETLIMEEYLNLKSQIFTELPGGIFLEPKGVFKGLNFKLIISDSVIDVKCIGEKKVVIDGVSYFNSHYISYKTLGRSKDILMII